MLLLRALCFALSCCPPLPCLDQQQRGLAACEGSPALTWPPLPPVLQLIMAAVWQVDGVILPTMAPAPRPSPGPSTTTLKTLAELVSMPPSDSTTFAMALQASGLVSSITSSGFRGTLLLPTNQVRP